MQAHSPCSPSTPIFAMDLHQLSSFQGSPVTLIVRSRTPWECRKRAIRRLKTLPGASPSKEMAAQKKKITSSKLAQLEQKIRSPDRVKKIRSNDCQMSVPSRWDSEGSPQAQSVRDRCSLRRPPRQPTKRQNSVIKDEQPKLPSSFFTRVDLPSLETGGCVGRELDSLKRQVQVQGMRAQKGYAQSA